MSSPTEDYEIGCILLEQPAFFEESDWIEAPDLLRERQLPALSQSGNQSVPVMVRPSSPSHDWVRDRSRLRSSMPTLADVRSLASACYRFSRRGT